MSSFTSHASMDILAKWLSEEDMGVPLNKISLEGEALMSFKVRPVWSVIWIQCEILLLSCGDGVLIALVTGMFEAVSCIHVPRKNGQIWILMIYYRGT